MDNLKVYLYSESTDCIATLALGDSYLERWEKLSLPFWELYCKNNNLSLVALISPFDDPGSKRLDWQKFLIGKAIRNASLLINNVCFVDYDIIPNPFAPSIFSECPPNDIGIVSQRFNLPYNDVNYLLKLIAFYRHQFSDRRYPLDSYLFASPEQIFIDHNLPPLRDYACGGLYLFNQALHSSFFDKVFSAYSSDSLLVSNPGEEVYLNYHIQSHPNLIWLNYKWQTLWWYEMASKYSWLYDKKRRDPALIRQCILNSLYNCHFLHFVGSWEKWAWPYCEGLLTEANLSNLSYFAEYLNIKPESPNLGIIFPTQQNDLDLLSK